MANINDMIYIIQLIALMGIFLYQMFNLMHKGTKYDIKIGFILIISLTIAWGMGLFVVLLEHSRATYAVIFQLETIFFVLGWLFFFFEVIFFGTETMRKEIKPFSSKEAQKSLNKG